MADRLDRRQVVAAAVVLLDAEGLDALSTRRLGAMLKSSANAMYWHVGSMENLVALAADAVVAEMSLAGSGSWRGLLADTARELRATFARHRWLAGAFAAHPQIHGPGIVRFQEHLLQVGQQAGFVGFDLDWAGSAVFTFVLGSAWGDAAPVPAHETDASADELLQRAGVDPAEHPMLRERYAALITADSGEVADDSFEFGLRALLDGLQARLDEPR